MASGADNVLRLFFQYDGSNVAANTSDITWWIDLEVNWGVNARMTGNVTISGSVVWNNQDFNPGGLTSGNTYRIAEGHITVTHRPDGTAEIVGVANLATRIQGQTWSFSKSATSDRVLPRLTYAPSAPGTPQVVSRTTSSVTFSWTPPGDWGRDNTNRYLVRTHNPLGAPSYFDSRITGNTFTMTGVAAGAQVGIVVAGNNVSGDGAWSGQGVGQAQILNPAAPPTTPAVARNSDTSHTLTWSVTSTETAPVTSVIVQRSDCRTGGPWATVTTLTGPATAYTDTSTVANRAYAWRVLAANASGSVASSPSACRPTTPSAPSGVTVVRQSNGQVVSWNLPQASAPAVVYTVEVSTDNGSTWAPVIPSPILSTSVLDTVVRTPALLYRIRATTASSYPAPSLSSGWAVSLLVPMVAPPGAPQNLSPNDTAVDVTDGLGLAWEYRSTDTSAQQAYEWRWRTVGGAWTYGGKTFSTDQASPVPAAWVNGSVYEWAVRTWGLHADPSIWSDTASVRLSARPTATIVSPSVEDPVESSVATVSWVYWDAESTPQAAWRATLYSESGLVLASASGTGVRSSLSFSYSVQDQTTYSITVVVTDSHGLDSQPATVTFLVEYAAPGVPLAWTDWDDETASVVLRIAPGESPVDTDYHDVYVSRDDGQTWYLLKEGLPPEGSVTDPRPNLRGRTLYATRSYNVGLETSRLVQPLTTVDHREPQGLGVLSFGRNLENPLLVTCNLALPSTDARPKQLVHTSGNSFPLMVQSYYEEQTLALTGTLRRNGLQLGEIETRLRSLGPAYWRDYLGRSFWCSVGPVSVAPTQSYEDHEQVHVDLGATLTRLESPEIPVQL